MAAVRIFETTSISNKFNLDDICTYEKSPFQKKKK
jgi:hypothetical protein